jgi:mersacidin/lichenicidin family type 2 lantibiotic
VSSFDLVRAWKDAEYRRSLNAEELALLPEHPAGSIELTDEELEQIDGGATHVNFTAGCCPSNVVSYCGITDCITLTIVSLPL